MLPLLISHAVWVYCISVSLFVFQVYHCTTRCQTQLSLQKWSHSDTICSDTVSQLKPAVPSGPVMTSAIVCPARVRVVMWRRFAAVSPAGAGGAAVGSGGLAHGTAPRRPAGGQRQQRGVHARVPHGTLPQGCQEALRQSWQKVKRERRAAHRVWRCVLVWNTYFDGRRCRSINGKTLLL